MVGVCMSKRALEPIGPASSFSSLVSASYSYSFDMPTPGPSSRCLTIPETSFSPLRHKGGWASSVGPLWFTELSLPRWNGSTIAEAAFNKAGSVYWYYSAAWHPIRRADHVILASADSAIRSSSLYVQMI